jgi:hypothetical protein
MLARAVTFDRVILALHIMSVVIAFGVLFSYPLFMAVGARLDPSSMPWFHRMQQIVSRRLISPGLLLVVIFGVILASELHAWKAFYVQWGIGASIVIGALEGMFMIPRTGRLAELARRDIEPGGAGTERVGTLSVEYRAVFRQVVIGSGAVSLIVLATIFVMAVHAGA